MSDIEDILEPQSKLLDKNYTGPLFLWDIDKTYLNTKFESLGGLIRTALEKAHQKENIAGTAVLLKQLSHGPSEKPQNNPVFFISASPKQMRKVIQQKMKLDGVSFDGIVFKDNLKNLYHGKLRKIKEQMGFKLSELLRLHLLLPPNCKMYLFGDDFENDAIIYMLFSDMCSRILSSEDIIKILKYYRVFPEDMRHILNLVGQIPKNNPVQRVYIHLERYSDPKKFEKFGSSLVTSYNFFQAALHLYYEQLISMDALERVARDLLENYYFTAKRIAWSIEDVAMRGLVPHKILSEICEILQGKLNIELHLHNPVSQIPEAVVQTLKAQVENIFKDPIKKYLPN